MNTIVNGLFAAAIGANGVAGRAGPVDDEASGATLSDAWLRRQFTTDHPSPAK